MITFIPNDISDYKEIKAFEDEKLLGTCIFEIQEGKSSVLLRELKMKEENISVQEGLIRSALNYAANRGMYMAFINSDSGFNESLIRRMNFEFKNNLFTCDIPAALQGNCCK